MAKSRTILPKYGRGFDGSPGSDVDLPARADAIANASRGAWGWTWAIVSLGTTSRSGLVSATGVNRERMVSNTTFSGHL
jgi:hypothetical protein